MHVVVLCDIGDDWCMLLYCVISVKIRACCCIVLDIGEDWCMLLYCVISVRFGACFCIV